MSSNLLPEPDFVEAVNKVFSPSGPIRRADMLKGRSSELDGIEQALNVKGRVAFIFGFRGVGKTSLGLTAASLLAREGEILQVSCDASQSTFQLAKEIAEAILGTDPLASTTESKLGFDLGVIKGEKGIASHTVVPDPHSINEATKIIESALRRKGSSYESGFTPLILVDEFDRLGSIEERHLVGDLLKQIADRGLPIRMIICGVAGSLDELFEGHGSAYRYIGSVGLDPLTFGARTAILSTGEDALGIQFSKDQQFRIAEISDGFPYYVHLLGETVTKAHYDRCREYEEKQWAFDFSSITTDDFNVGVERAIAQCQGHLKAMYSKATKKYAPVKAGEFTITDYELILWAAAGLSTFENPGSAIFTEYERLRRILELRSASLIEDEEDEADDEVPTPSAPTEDQARTRFNQRITRLKKPSHGNVLRNARRGWWEFTEPMLRGYCRLMAKGHGIDLGGEISSR
jgi:hypothetical protein